MRVSRLLAACCVGALASCSLITSFDGLGSGGAGGGTSSTAVASTSTSGGQMTGGAGGGGGGSSSVSAGGGGAGGGTDAGTGGQDACPPGSFHCGTGSDKNTLYSCNASHQEVLVEHCAHGCVVRTGGGDMCGCQKGGFYCGGDDLVGDKNTLYTCKVTGGISGTVKEHCAAGCVVAPPGSDDHCN